jgi:O-acetyl-ADP-ribose deacetylase (regulator of RNase III)
MIVEGHGNLLEADAEALVNTVNTVGVMGKGIALQFKRAFPANFRAYRDACRRGEVRLGHVWTFDTGAPGPHRYILNFPTKGHWRDNSRLEDVRAGLDSLLAIVAERGITSVGIPALGCGNGGLDWRDVRPLIQNAFADLPDVRAIVFPPEGAPDPAVMPNATAAPRLTLPRALVVVAVERYLRRARLQEVRDGVSELEIQKLAYFLQALGEPLALRFVRGSYGPYSPALGHVLDALEGHHLTGLGDRSARVTELAPITTLPGSVDAATRVLDGHVEAGHRLDQLLDLVDGFETPYSLELLATVHYAATRRPQTGEPAELTDRVRSWSTRKARMFTQHQVRVAADRLTDRDLLPPTATGAESGQAAS